MQDHDENRVSLGLRQRRRSRMGGMEPSHIRLREPVSDSDIRRREFLEEVKSVLSSSLDTHTCMQGIAELAVPRFADWCVIEMVDPDGQLRLEAEAHVHSDRLGIAAELRRQRPSNADSPYSVSAVIRSAQGVLLSDIADAIDDHRTRDPEDLRILKALGVTSALVVPIGGSAVLAVLQLFSLREDRHYSLEDLACVQRLACNVSAAIEHGRSYSDVDELMHASERLISGSAKHELLTPLAALILQLESVQRKLWETAFDRHESSELSRGVAKSLSQARRLSDRLRRIFGEKQKRTRER